MDIKPIVKYRTLAIAKDLTPVDTGNLRHNATKLRDVRQNSWTIHYSSIDANYIEYVEEGTQRQFAQRFIARTSVVLANYLKSYLNNQPTKRWYNEKTLKGVLDTSESDAQRRFRHRQSIMNYYSKL